MKLSIMDHEKKAGYCEGITFLRGIACIYVIFCHLFGSWYKFATNMDSVLGVIWRYFSYFTQPIAETNAGVIFFVVLSGYCIHRSRCIERLSSNDIKLFYLKRVVRIVPLLWGGIIIGILCYYASFNQYLTESLTATDGISFWRILLRISGISVLVPFGYEKTYLGNAPLATVLVEIYLYLLYPVMLYLDSKCRIIWKIVYALFWGVCINVVIWRSGYSIWWQNIALFSFLPYWYIGAITNDRKSNFKFCYILIAYALLFVPFRMGISNVGLILISEVRKILFAIFCAGMIRIVDDRFEHIGFSTYGVMDIGKISFSLYVIHGPVLIWLLGTGMDIISIMIVLGIFGEFFYLLIEKRISNIIYRRLIDKRKKDKENHRRIPILFF